MLARMEECCRRKRSFSLESTISGKAYLRRIPEWQQQGYFVVLPFLRLPSIELALKRLELRVKHGGHHIPDDVVKRRFERGLMHLQDYQNAVDEWTIWDGEKVVWKVPEKELEQVNEAYSASSATAG